jgi:hypothetical protein
MPGRDRSLAMELAQEWMGWALADPAISEMEGDEQ